VSASELVHASLAPTADPGRRPRYRGHGVELTLELAAPPLELAAPQPELAAPQPDHASSERTRSASQV